MLSLSKWSSRGLSSRVLPAWKASASRAPRRLAALITVTLLATASLTGAQLGVQSAQASPHDADAKATPVITEFPIPGGADGNQALGNLTEGPDGNIWFVGRDPPLVERILSHAPYTVTQFPVPTDDSYVSDIITDPDGNLWFTEQGDFHSEGALQPGKVGRILAHAPNTITEFNLADPPSNRARVFQIVVGPDKNLYFTETCTLGTSTVPSCPAGAGSVGRLSPFGSNAQIQASVTQVAHPAPCGPAICNSVADITVGPDRNLWVTDNSNIGRLTVRGHNTLTEFPVPNGVRPPFLTSGPDGNLWFTGGGTSNNFGRLSPFDPDNISLFTASATSASPNSQGIVTGPDRNLWFAEYTNNTIGTFSPFSPNHVTEFILPTPNSEPRSLTVGSCNTIWFTGQAGVIGRIQLDDARQAHAHGELLDSLLVTFSHGRDDDGGCVRW